MLPERFLELTTRLDRLNMVEIQELKKAYDDYSFEHGMFGGCLLNWIREESELLTGTDEQKRHVLNYRHRQLEQTKRWNETEKARESTGGRIFVSIVVDDLDAREDATRSGRIYCYNATRAEVYYLLGMVKRLRDRKP
jgi:hypothetical protein